MIHYHGLPINPQSAAAHAVGGAHAFVTFADPHPLGLAVELCQSFAIDNGAFSAWTSGKPVTDWTPFYAWAEQCMRIPSCDFAVIPDVIDGDELANDRLLYQWPLPKWFGAPVWHMHESLERLAWLVATWPRVCLGSSGEFATIGNAAWWNRMAQAMEVACDGQGRPRCRLHGLRMLARDVYSRLPFASADSTHIARTIGIDSGWKGTYQPPTKEARAIGLRTLIESAQAPSRWTSTPIQESLCL